MSVRLSRLASKDIHESLSYVEEKNPQATQALAKAIDKLLADLDARAFEGQEKKLRSGRVVRYWPLPPLGIYYQRRGAELYIVRVYHQARRPITR